MTLQPPSDDDQRAGLSTPQFGISTLLCVTAGLCVVSAVWAAGGPVMGFVATVLMLAIFAHVAGNAVGTKLKENARRRDRQAQTQAQTQAQQIELSGEHYAPATNLGEKSSLGVTIVILTAAGFLVGAIGGGGLLTYLNWEEIVWQSIAVAAIASGVLGGLAGFWLSNFVHVMIVAHLQASRDARRK